MFRTWVIRCLQRISKISINYPLAFQYERVTRPLFSISSSTVCSGLLVGMWISPCNFPIWTVHLNDEFPKEHEHIHPLYPLFQSPTGYCSTLRYTGGKRDLQAGQTQEMELDTWSFSPSSPTSGGLRFFNCHFNSHCSGPWQFLFGGTTVFLSLNRTFLVPYIFYGSTLEARTWVEHTECRKTSLFQKECIESVNSACQEILTTVLLCSQDVFPKLVFSCHIQKTNVPL